MKVSRPSLSPSFGTGAPADSPRLVSGAFAIGVLVLIPLTRFSAPWTMLAAGVVGAGNLVVVGLVGVATSPDVMVLFADGVTAVLSAFLLFSALRAYRESRSH